MLFKIGAAVALAAAQWLELHSREARRNAADALHWVGVNAGSYAIEALTRAGHGITDFVHGQSPHSK